MSTNLWTGLFLKYHSEFKIFILMFMKFQMCRICQSFPVLIALDFANALAIESVHFMEAFINIPIMPLLSRMHESDPLM